MDYSTLLAFEAKAQHKYSLHQAQNGRFNAWQKSELSLYKTLYNYSKRILCSLFSAERMDQQKLQDEIKELKSILVLEKGHNERLKEQCDYYKHAINKALKQ